MAPVGLELTMAARDSVRSLTWEGGLRSDSAQEGMSEIHQFAAMNISYCKPTSRMVCHR